MSRRFDESSIWFQEFQRPHPEHLQLPRSVVVRTLPQQDDRHDAQDHPAVRRDHGERARPDNTQSVSTRF